MGKEQPKVQEIILTIKEDPSTLQVNLEFIITYLKEKIKSFQGGNLKNYLNVWKEITSDQSILKTVGGLDLDSEEINFTNKNKHLTHVDKQEEMGTEINTLIKKSVIEKSNHESGEFISPIFLRKKREGFRLILNLKELNQYLDTIHFKMDTIYSVKDLITPNCFMSSIDLKDAYYTVPIQEDYQKYFKFIFQGNLFNFTCLPNGFCHGPRKFTKLLKPVLAQLRRLDHVIAAYIDDMLNIGEDYNDCVRNVADTILWFDKLGFHIHPEKSKFIPSQEITFLGFVINSVDMTIKITTEKKLEIKNICDSVLKNPWHTIRTISSMIGKMTASFPGVRYRPLHYRNLKSVALKNNNKGNFDKKMKISSLGVKDINWWINNIMDAFAFINLGNPELCIETDACNTGWGAICNGSRAKWWLETKRNQ